MPRISWFRPSWQSHYFVSSLPCRARAADADASEHCTRYFAIAAGHRDRCDGSGVSVLVSSCELRCTDTRSPLAPEVASRADATAPRGNDARSDDQGSCPDEARNSPPGRSLASCLRLYPETQHTGAGPYKGIGGVGAIGGKWTFVVLRPLSADGPQ